jgi:hypothetical protein
VPVIYCYLDDLAAWAKRLAGGRQEPADPGLAPVATK